MSKKADVRSYTKRPVKVEAVKWTGKMEDFKGVQEWVYEHMSGLTITDICLGGHAIDCRHAIIIPTLEGSMTASPNDYIIKGIIGELYPCKPDVFDFTYTLNN